MARYQLIVGRDRADLRKYWTWWFAGIQDVRVIRDRRRGERRHRRQGYEPERRHAERRRTNIEHELHSDGFAIIFLQEGSPPA